MRTLTVPFRGDRKEIVIEQEQSNDPQDGGAVWYFEDGSDPILTAKEEQEIANIIEETREESCD